MAALDRFGNAPGNLDVLAYLAGAGRLACGAADVDVDSSSV